MALKLAVLLSGSGSTLQNLLDRSAARTLDADVACVIASRADAYGLERARNAGVPARAVLRKNFSDTASFSDAVWREITPYNVDLVVLAGFMCLIAVPPGFTNRIMNVHPSLIPAFCGKGMYGDLVHKAVLDYGAKVTGVTIHFVDQQYDNGPIILQQPVPVEESDTPDTLAARVQAHERDLYPQAIQLFADNRLRVEGRRVRILPK
ncbi:MAG: phosphoribosylglycinamide formyltransferase [Candidatus Hydrogenedentales bacterium]